MLARATSSSGSSTRRARSRSPRSSAHSRCAPRHRCGPAAAARWTGRGTPRTRCRRSRPPTAGPGPPRRAAPRREHPDGLGVGGREDRGRRVVRRQQLGRVLARDGRAVRAAPDQVSLKADARRRQRLPVPAQAVRGGRETQPGRGPGERRVTDEADPAVPQRDQVPGGQLPARHVIDDRLRHPGGDRVHADQRHPGPAELGQVLAGQRQADGQHAVGAVGGQQRLQMAVTLKRRVHVAHDRVVALIAQHRERAGHPDHGRRPGHVRDEHGHGPGRPPDQRRRCVTGPVAQPVDGILDGEPGGRPDLVTAVQHARYRAHPDSGIGRHVRDGTRRPAGPPVTWKRSGKAQAGAAWPDRTAETESLRAFGALADPEHGRYHFPR